MLATSKNVLFPRTNHLLTTGADDPSLQHSQIVVAPSFVEFRIPFAVFHVLPNKSVRTKIIQNMLQKPEEH